MKIVKSPNWNVNVDFWKTFLDVLFNSKITKLECKYDK
ncbi:hypothetical protein HMPREF1143_1534 [Peptoanaerobacter stomatis]|uniref:Uncharacterized protein n=1 Tax=Peptoanaerobacter stomatis TaxID=796937 RepID=J6H3J9_9FIRM|nr:hypothetical protein HMPREF1143_1534 [Peptoanaerobacter stomatis]